MIGRQDRREFFRMRGDRMEIFGRNIGLPANRAWRIALGVGLVLLGILGFLPILGFWMVPLGLLILSVDLVFVRRWRRRASVRWGRRKSRRADPALQAPPLQRD